MINYKKVLDFGNECYAGFKVGFQHDYWAAKNTLKKIVTGVTKIVLKNSDTDHSHSTSDNSKNGSVSGLKVVGVGFGRTGTYSLGLALNKLGYPTLHTYHLYENSDIIDMWTEKVFRPAIESNKMSMGNPDFNLIASSGYTSAVDFPIAFYFEELNEQYPDCKFVLTVRENSEVWFKSWRNMAVNIAQTTNMAAGFFKHVNQLALYVRWLLALVHRDESLLSIPLGKSLPNPDKAKAIFSYEDHNRRVKEIIPSGRLLEYDVKQGWEPLCKFLQVEECPEIPFPKTNSSVSLKVQTITSVLIPLSIILFILFTAFAFGFQKLTGKKVLPWLDQRYKRFGHSMKNSNSYSSIKNKEKTKQE